MGRLLIDKMLHETGGVVEIVDPRDEEPKPAEGGGEAPAHLPAAEAARAAAKRAEERRLKLLQRAGITPTPLPRFPGLYPGQFPSVEGEAPGTGPLYPGQLPTRPEVAPQR